MKSKRDDNLVEVKICFGHLSPISDKCNTCKTNEENNYCSHYQSYPAKVGPNHPLHPHYRKEN